MNHLSRTRAHRKALMRNLSGQLIQHKRITTTLAKAKALRVHIEPLLTKSKNDNMHNRRVAFSYLQDKEIIKELFGTVGTKIADRPGGYCRIIKLQKRIGDAADMALIELVDFNETYDTGKEIGSKKKRTRRGKKPATPKQETKVVESEQVEDVTTDSVQQESVASAVEQSSEAGMDAEQEDTSVESTDDKGDSMAEEDTNLEEPSDNSGEEEDVV